MGRRQKSEGEAVSLFPFLSILACVIGTLTLMIAATAISQMGKEQTQDQRDLAEEYESIEKQIAEFKEDLEKKKKLIASNETIDKDLKDAIEELKRLEKEQKKKEDEMNNESTPETKLLAESNRLFKRLEELKKDPIDRKKEIEKLLAEIKKRKITPKEANVVIQPGGSGLNIDPYFVECTKNGVRLLDDSEEKFIRLQDLNKEDGEFHGLLDSIAAKEKGTMLLLLRPDGIGTYNRVRSIARTHYSDDGYCPVGKLPVSTQGKIDLSIFRKKDKPEG